MEVRRLPLLSFSSVWGLHFVAFGALTFLPVLTLGPVVEHLLMLQGQTF